MEQSKHLEPKFSGAFRELTRHVNEFRVSLPFSLILIQIFIEKPGKWR